MSVPQHFGGIFPGKRFFWLGEGALNNSGFMQLFHKIAVIQRKPFRRIVCVCRIRRGNAVCRFQHVFFPVQQVNAALLANIRKVFVYA